MQTPRFLQATLRLLVCSTIAFGLPLMAADDKPSDVNNPFVGKWTYRRSALHPSAGAISKLVWSGI